jgi:trans-aconitate methyltransferase
LFVILQPVALATGQNRLAGVKGIQWLVADGEQTLPGRYDLITASSVFQWLSGPARACRLYWEYLHPGGLLVPLPPWNR